MNLLELVAHQHVLPSSTTPTVPFGENVVAEHEQMIRTVHRLSPLFANDIRAAGGRVRAWTIAAESVLHDLGAISMMSSDSMGMGRIGEVRVRTWQLAHVMGRSRRAPRATATSASSATWPSSRSTPRRCTAWPTTSGR